MTSHGTDYQLRRLLIVHRLLGRGFGERAPQEQHGNDCRQGSNHERDAPAPHLELVGRQQCLQDSKHQKGQELSANQRHVLEGVIEPTRCPFDATSLM